MSNGPKHLKYRNYQTIFNFKDTILEIWTMAGKDMEFYVIYKYLY
jgi:hypothetical protein